MLVLACTAMTLLAGVFVLTPLFKEPKGNLEVELLAETELDRLLNRKAIVYTNLKDLEFENKMGRLSEADYRRLEAGYRSEASVILKELDELGVEKDVEDSIERDVAARKARLFSAGRPEAGTCPECGTTVVPGKKFCADCGHRL